MLGIAVSLNPKDSHMKYFMLIIVCVTTSEIRALINQNVCFGRILEACLLGAALTLWFLNLRKVQEILGYSGTWGFMGVGWQLLTYVWKYFNYLLTVQQYFCVLGEPCSQRQALFYRRRHCTLEKSTCSKSHNKQEAEPEFKSYLQRLSHFFWVVPLL